MRDAISVITEAVNGHTKELAAEFEVSLPRMYEILSKDNPYPKARRLIRKIARVNPEGLHLIKSDMDAFFLELCGAECIETSELTRELFEGGQSVVAGASRQEQIRELREAMAAAAKKIGELEREGREERKSNAHRAVVTKFARAK